MIALQGLPRSCMCLYSRLDVLTPSVLRITDSFALLNLLGMGQEKSENSSHYVMKQQKHDDPGQRYAGIMVTLK